jgi:hypothetical protein
VRHSATRSGPAQPVDAMTPPLAGATTAVVASSLRSRPFCVTRVPPDAALVLVRAGGTFAVAPPFPAGVLRRRVGVARAVPQANGERDDQRGGERVAAAGRLLVRRVRMSGQAGNR